MPSVRATPRAPRRTLLGVPLEQFSRALAVAFLAAVAAVLPTSAPPAEATSTYLCTGYSGCADAGYSSAGYAERSSQMYWRMYSGHNCTNYVAYRMIRAGMSSERPWSGSGNASNWGHAMSGITDRTPNVGAVAWWDQNVPGAGSAGHVAYVEKVVSATEIVVSEDSWSGDFHWRRIYKSGTGWPTGFVHFVDEKKELERTSATAIRGTPRVGATLRLQRSRWTPRVGERTYQWWVGDAAVRGANEPTYTPTAADRGKRVGVVETVTRRDYEPVTSTAVAPGTVAEGVLRATSTPAISGAPDAGQVLTAGAAAFSPSPDAITYGWKFDGQRRPKLDGRTLQLTRAMIGKQIELVTVARKKGYGLYSEVRGAVGPVMAGTVQVATPFTSAGTARRGETLSFAAGTFTPASATVAYEWLRDGVVVPEATEPTYVLRAEDVGHQMSARATVAKPAWRPATQAADFGLVTTDSTLGVRGHGGRRTAVVKVRVRAPGDDVPTGVVTARVGHRTTSARIVEGRATLTVANVAPGERRVFVSYDGDGVALPARKVHRVVVKPRR